MELRDRKSGDVITDVSLRLLHPNTSFPEVLTPEIIDSFGCDPVLEGSKPELVSPYQSAQRDGVVEVDGQWFTRYIVVEPDAEGKAAMDTQQAQRVRDDRSKRLADCDWTQLPDAPVDGAPWVAYRQALREIPEQEGFPWEINWPVPPVS